MAGIWFMTKLPDVSVLSMTYCCLHTYHPSLGRTCEHRHGRRIHGHANICAPTTRGARTPGHTTPPQGCAQGSYNNGDVAAYQELGPRAIQPEIRLEKELAVPTETLPEMKESCIL